VTLDSRALLRQSEAALASRRRVRGNERSKRQISPRHPESLTENEAESFQGVAGRSIERKSQITSAEVPNIWALHDFDDSDTSGKTIRNTLILKAAFRVRL
jgi:hypothetical protein